jgi:phospholipid/cholesterol/gamma-HCH transport system ATP-binding protein
MRLARRFGLPGLPAERPAALPEHVLLRAACVKAFLGEPVLVVIEDPDVATFPSLHQALAAEFIAVQNRGGAVICCVASLAAGVCGMLGPAPWLRLSDRGLGSARRPHERLASLRQ